MASFYSKPADYGTYTQAIDLELVNFVMGSKQQKYDYNLAKVESKIKDELGSIDLERAQDKEYFLGKASEVLSSMGDLSKLDWSKNGVTRQVDSQLSSIVDDRVLNDAMSTRNYRTFQQTLGEKQKKGDGSYSVTNAAHAMQVSGAKAWLNGEAESVGSIAYQDHVDVGGELKDISENLHKFANVYKRRTPNGDGTFFVDETGEQLSSSEVRAIAEAQLSSKAKEQMRIDGWAAYDGGVRSVDEISTDFKEFATSKLEDNQKKIDSIDLELEALKGSNSPKIKTLEAEKQQWQDYGSKINEEYGGFVSKGNTGAMTTTMQNERVLGQFGRTFAINNITASSTTANPYKLADYNERLKRETMAIKATLDANTAAAKRAREGAEDLHENLSTFDRTIRKGDPGYNAVNYYDKEVANVANYDKNYKGLVNTTFAALPPEVQKKLNGKWESQGKATGMSKELFLETEMENFSEGEKALVPEGALVEIETARIRRDRSTQTVADETTAALQQLESTGLDNFVEEYSDNINIRVLDAEGNPVNAKTYFEKNNIKNGEDLRNAPDVKKTLLKSYYADKLIEGSEPGFIEKLKIAFSVTPMALGTPISGGSAIDVNRIEGGDMYLNRLNELFDGDEKKAALFLEQAAAKGLGKQPASGTTPQRGTRQQSNIDTSVEDDNTLENFVTVEKVKRTAANNMAEKGVSTTTAGVEVPGGSDLAQTLMNRITNHEATLTEAIVPKFAPGRSFSIIDMQDGTLRVGFTAERKGLPVAESVILPKSNLPTEFLERIDLDMEGPLFTRDNMQEVTSPVKMIDEVNLNKLTNMAGMRGLEAEDIADLVTKQGLGISMRQGYPDLMGTKAKPTEIGQAINNMVESNDVTVKISNISGKFHKQIIHTDPKTGSPTLLFSSLKPIPEADYDLEYFNTKHLPQLDVFQAIESGLRQTQAEGEENPAEIISNILSIYGK